MSPRTMLLRASAARPSFFLTTTMTNRSASLSSLLSRMQLQTKDAQFARRTIATTTTTATKQQAPPPSSTEESSNPPPTTSNTSSSSSSEVADEILKSRRQRNPFAHTLKFGTVLTAGRMDKTVRVKHKFMTYDKKLRKEFADSKVYKVHDPNNSLREGDVIQFSAGYRVSKTVRHVVERIVTPFGTPVEERPKVLEWWEREKRGGREEPGRVKKLVAERLNAPHKEAKLLREFQSNIGSDKLRDWRRRVFCGTVKVAREAGMEMEGWWEEELAYWAKVNGRNRWRRWRKAKAERRE
ncbi:hypothetical protein AJ79_08250 [Helicocarpus griseus UAMH5409]|uniref:Ribosomal protein S17 n=1 Tax=Helicocarpus griseus UAMH5409 TaxID=1447875 RepID=A0A2B7WUP6_9EURO|nr:hypothetical protein AJ79_08250 [Helicocarpus griseus UAMH5409]